MRQTATSKVFQSNNLAVAYLMNGNDEQARSLLLNAFDETSQQVRAVAEASAAIIKDPTHNAASLTLPVLPRDCLLRTMQGALRSSSAARDVVDHRERIHYGAQALMMALPEDFSCSSQTAEDSRNVHWSLVSAFVVYNLGIMYQMASTRCTNTTRPSSKGQSRGQTEDDAEYVLLGRSHKMFASAKSLLQHVSQSATLVPTGNPLVDFLSLLTQFKLIETASRAATILDENERTSSSRAYKELEEQSRLLLNLVSQFEAIIFHPLCQYEDSEVSRMFRKSCHELVVHCYMLQPVPPYSSSTTAGAA
mmetsp:Transcript_62686/g.94638  ORF Transcript_62686/g.94638 Transcript_62686/m.94638 type:complete len:307 (+) Transcript_62686:69-989(+)